MVLDGGACAVGVESTVVDLTGRRARLLRPGGIPQEAIEAVVGKLAIDDPVSGPTRLVSPGQLASHYAPRQRVRPNATHPRAGEAYLAFGKPPALAREGTTLNLSPTGSLQEAAANLFAMLQALDRPEFAGIAVAPIPRHGLGQAINDRLKRAAAPRR
jgi:L-threonylcarbamoyladenylate synthase